MNKNVLILEVGGSHIECVHTMIHFLDLKECNVFVACNEKLIGSLVQTQKIKDILPLPNEISKRGQFVLFFQLRKYLSRNKIGTVIINTVELTIIRDMLLFLPRLNYVGIIHNARKLEKSFTITKLVSKKVKKMLVLGNYLLSKIDPAPVFNVVSFFPVYFPPVENKSLQKPAGEFWIVVPGLAVSSRRDYAGFINELKKTNELPANFKFIFLGEYKLDDIVDQETKQSVWWKKHIIVFDGFVDYNSFHAYMKLTDVILPLMKNDSDDFYGNSRISGSFNLGLGYKKPFALPTSYKKNTDLLPYSIYYENIEQSLSVLKQFSNSAQEQNEIATNYAGSPYNNIDQMADRIYNFIFSK